MTITCQESCSFSEFFFISTYKFVLFLKIAVLCKLPFLTLTIPHILLFASCLSIYWPINFPILNLGEKYENTYSLGFVLLSLPSVSLTLPLATCLPSEVSPGITVPFSKVPRWTSRGECTRAAHHSYFILSSENIKVNVSMNTQKEHHSGKHNNNHEF